MTGAGWTTLGNKGNGINQFDAPTSAFVDTDRHMIVTDTNNHRIVRVSDMTGAGWTVLGTNGSGAGQFNFPQFTFVR
jgi:hypothetical protein